MGHSIPVMFTSVPAAKVYVPGTSWLDAQEELSEALEAGSLWQDTSRNWWHVYLTLRLAEALSLEPLRFLQHECITVPYPELSAVETAVDRLIQEIRSGTVVSPLAGDYDYELVASEAHRSAIDEAEPNRDNDDEDRSGSEGVRLYFSFLRSMQAACREARAGEGNLLFVQPQP